MARTTAPTADRAQTGDVTILPVRRLSGVYTPPPDKSISHRALILAALATGRSTVTPLSRSADVAGTAACLRQLGVAIDAGENQWVIQSPGVNQWTAPERALDCGNSGTTMRLLAGCLAGGRFSSRLVGDPSLSHRPMARLAEPLQRMGANITLAAGNVAPIEIVGLSLRGIEYELPVASAQIKSAILLAGLQASGNVSVIEPIPSRDHTERMLAAAGVGCTVDVPRRPPGDWREQLLASDGDAEPDSPARRTIRLGAGRSVRPCDWTVPGDFSAAAFIIAAAIGVHKSDIIISDVGLNPTRTGFLRAVRRMGATVDVKPKGTTGGEPCGQIRLQSAAALKAIKVSAAEIPALIDELPILAVLAARAEGVAVIRGAGELRHKESDRIATVTANLRAMGVKVAELEDGWAIEGPTEWHAATIDPAGDHRIAMAFAVAALWADGPSTIQDARIAGVSDPDFFDSLSALSR
ncbi:MAG: 3-phosphoshikimate 1-carboxyvinyltransferase [candidate division Zixibacteria bacterium]|nr:3-phosphoshikimate 1-carboxyvinyltransferase [candidate division Zixibacteria bacterium]